MIEIISVISVEQDFPLQIMSLNQIL